MSLHPIHTLVVVGGSTYVGQEVARFGRALGHRIILTFLESPPELTEPWMHGVRWEPLSTLVLADFDPLAVIYCDTCLVEERRGQQEEILLHRPRALMQACQRLTRPPRFVLRSTVTQPFLPRRFTSLQRQSEENLKATELDQVVLQMPLLYGPLRPDSVAAMLITRLLLTLPSLPRGERAALRPLRVETAALALLRAALEPDLPGILTTEEIAHLGDVMIAQ